MNFYQEWKECVDNHFNDDEYLEKYLLSDCISTEIFINGDIADINFATDFLVSLPMSKFFVFIKNLDINKIGQITSNDIPQFSNFDKGTIEICKVLKVCNGLNYKQIGDILCQTSKTDIAKQKFGENHSKLASYFNLIYFTKNSSTIIANISNLGVIFNDYSVYKKDDLLKVLLIRQKFILRILFELMNGNDVELSKVCNFLSESTIKRRSSNIKYLMNFILIGSKYRKLIDEIKI